MLALLLAAPVLAELLQAYLPDVGAVLEILFFVAFTVGGVLARTLFGYLAPVPQGVELSAKLAQNTMFLVFVLALGALMWVRTRELDANVHNEADDRALRTPPPR